ncbi:MAG: flagellar hook-basal body complex protein [Rhodospirillales bacterium]|nr:flagellar hook-basal body complex protein [Rhodospirillales bacterium]
MSLSGAYNNGVSGLLGYSSAMGAITENITNIRTPGYKRTEQTFSTLLGGQELNGSETGGVRTSTRRLVDAQGAIEATGRIFDIAVNGPGFFVFGDELSGATGNIAYSRAGDLDQRAPNATPTLGYLSNKVGQYLLAWKADANGNFTYGGVASLQAIEVNNQAPFAGVATVNASLAATIPASSTTATTQIFYVDATGNSQQLNLDWTKTGPNAWDLQISDPAGAPVAGPFAQTFDSVGNLTSATALNVAGLFNLDVSSLTQRGSVFNRIQYQQDGLEKGEFLNFKVADDGTIFGHFSSGAVRPLYRIPVAIFPNPNKLDSLSGNVYQPNDLSGDATLRQPGDDFTRIAPNAVEFSNVDLGDGFTQMIITQRAYSSAAQVVRTVDEMTQTLRDIKR